MAKFTERLDIKMTSQDMLLLSEASLKARLPLTVYARELIISQLNPMLQKSVPGGENESLHMEKTISRPVED